MPWGVWRNDSIRLRKQNLRRCQHKQYKMFQTCSSPGRLTLPRFCTVINIEKHKSMYRSIGRERERERERDYRFSTHVKRRYIVMSCFQSLLSENIVFCFHTSELFSKAGYGNNCSQLTKDSLASMHLPTSRVYIRDNQRRTFALCSLVHLSVTLRP